MNATKNLTAAHAAVLNIATKASAYLAEYEGTGATLSYGEIASGIGIDLRSLGKCQGYLCYLGIDAAVEFRSWANISDKGEPSRFTKPATVTEFRKPRTRAEAKRA